MFQSGQVVQFHYPICPRVNAHLEFRPRELIVRRIRDLVVEPLTPIEYGRRPLLLRGRYLVEGSVPGCGWRRFYPSSSLEFFRPAPLRIGAYDPDGAGRPESLYPVAYGPSVRDRIRLMHDLRRLMDLEPETVWGVFADDLRRVGDFDRDWVESRKAG